MSPRFRSEPCATCGSPRAFVDGAWLRAQRTRARLTLREVARRLNFTPSYICDLELNRRQCSKALAGRFLEALR